MKLKCSGPGPHEPADGILGEADVDNGGHVCSSAACAPPAHVPAPEEPTAAERIAAIEAALAALTKGTSK